MLTSNAEHARRLDNLEKKYDAQFKTVSKGTLPGRAGSCPASTPPSILMAQGNLARGLGPHPTLPAFGARR